MMRTRWLCSGYGFAVVGGSDDSFFADQIAASFRHHYFRMGLIAHFQRASLLTFRDQLAKATRKTGKEYRKHVMSVQSAAIKFRTRFWFREVSTQHQGQEIFAWWSDRLGNPALFDQVAADIAAAETQVRTEFESAEAHDIAWITRFGGGIAALGMVLAVMSLVVALLALETSASLTGTKLIALDHWAFIAWIVAGACFIALIGATIAWFCKSAIGLFSSQ